MKQYVSKFSGKELDERLTKVDNIPTKTSELNNDSGFISEVKADNKYTDKNKTDVLERDIKDLKDKIDSEIPTKISQLENDKKYITDSEVQNKLNNLNNVVDYFGDLIEVSVTSKGGNIDSVEVNEGILANTILKKANLDKNGKIIVSQLPDYILGQVMFGGLIYSDGTITASSNFRSKYGNDTNISASEASKYNGVYFIVASDAVNITIVGVSQVSTGDWIISVGDSWKKIDNSDAVTSVAGLVGNVNASSLAAALSDITGSNSLAKKTDLPTKLSDLEIDVPVGGNPDWADNDVNSQHYIYNRTHYIAGNSASTICFLDSKEEGDIIVTGLIPGNYYQIYDYNGSSSTTFTFINGAEVTLPVGPPIKVVCEIVENDGCLKLITPVYGYNHSISISSLDVKQLDDVFIPDNIVRKAELPKKLSDLEADIEIGGASDWNAQPGESGYIENKPVEKIIFNGIIESDNTIVYDYNISSTSAYISLEGTEILHFTEYGEEQEITLDWPNIKIYWNGVDKVVITNLSDDPIDSIKGYISVYGYDRQLPSSSIDDTVIKTFPQTLSDDAKNQARSNLGISNPDWNAQKGEAGYIENNPFILRHGYEGDEVTKDILEQYKLNLDEFEEYTFVDNYGESFTGLRKEIEGYGFLNQILHNVHVVGSGNFTKGSFILSNFYYISFGDIGEITFNEEDINDKRYITINWYNNFSAIDELPNFDVYIIPDWDPFFMDTLPSELLPDTVVKTTRQYLSDSQKNQVKENLGILTSGEDSKYISVITDKTLTTPNAVGGIAKGTKVSDLEGKTFAEMFDDLLFPTVNPTFTAPSASIAFKNYSSTQEVGATGPTSANFTTGYNAGEIKLNGVKQANRGGTLNSTNSFIYVNGSSSNKILPTKVTLGSTTFKYRAAYNQGPQPKNNKGGNYDSPLAAGTVDSSAITLNGTYPWYASTSTATSTNPVVKQSLVAWNSTAGKMSTGQFTVQPSGTLPQVFKLPRKIDVLQLKNALNGNMENVEEINGIPKDYTESTETINIGGTNVTYYVYTYSGSTRGSVTLLAKF